MSALGFLLIAVVLSTVGTSVLLLRNRRPTSMESGIDAFRREMRALAPDEGQPGSGGDEVTDADGRSMQSEY